LVGSMCRACGGPRPGRYCLALLLERFTYYLGRKGARGDALAESRGAREDRRLKESFTRLWERGTDYAERKQFQDRLASKKLKVKTKPNNIAGLQLADLLAHPSRQEIHWENRLIEREPGRFAKRIIEILEAKYDQQESRVFGKKLL